MRVRVGFIKRVALRLRRAIQGTRLKRVRVRGRTVRRGRLGRAVRRGRVGRAIARGWALVTRRPARAVASSRVARAARERLGRTHRAGLLVGGGAAVALGVLSSMIGTAEQSRAAAGANAPVVRTASAATSPTRFELTRDVVPRRRPSRAGRAYYRKTTSRHVSSAAEVGFLPLYREAARAFGVSWQLIASIHRQETAFSTVAGTYHGLNAFGCCAGPMQFNVTNGPVSTWERYRESFRLGERPHHYPHPTRTHPSVYDDFDAIMATGALLRDSGATDDLGGGAWSAAYAYYGHDRFGVGYADQVVARAQGWELNGFCVNCPEDTALVAVLDDLYGVDARRELRAEERRRKHDKHKRHKKPHEGEASTQAGESSGGDPQPPRVPASGREPVAAPPLPDPVPAPSTTTPQPTTTTVAPPTTTTPAPPAQKPCTPVTRLLGCRP
jgi:hypothetical protein